MKNDTYDVPAYRFGIIKIDWAMPGEEYQIKDYQQALSQRRCTVIPFENIDGLTIEEVKNHLGTKEVCLIGYTYYETGQDEQLCRNYYVIMQAYASAQRLEKSSDMTIDRVFEEIFEESYKKLDNNQKRACHCFFERYQDKDYQKTYCRIQNINTVL